MHHNSVDDNSIWVLIISGLAYVAFPGPSLAKRLGATDDDFGGSTSACSFACTASQSCGNGSQWYWVRSFCTLFGAGFSLELSYSLPRLSFCKACASQELRPQVIRSSIPCWTQLFLAAIWHSHLASNI